MVVTVEGVITSVELKTKDDKKSTEVLLAQKGEKMQVPVRLPGHVDEKFTLFEVATFTGRLMEWRTRDGIGNMVMVEE